MLISCTGLACGNHCSSQEEGRGGEKKRGHGTCCHAHSSHVISVVMLSLSLSLSLSHAQQKQKELTLKRRQSRQKQQDSKDADYADNADLDDLIAALKSGEYFDMYARRRSRRLSVSSPRNSRLLENSRDRPPSINESLPYSPLPGQAQPSFVQ